MDRTFSYGSAQLGQVRVCARVQQAEVSSAALPLQISYDRSSSRQVLDRDQQMENLRVAWLLARAEEQRSRAPDPAQKLRLTEELIDLSRRAGKQRFTARLEHQRQQLQQHGALDRDGEALMMQDVRQSGRLAMILPTIKRVPPMRANRLDVACATHPGHLRRRNEDACGVRWLDPGCAALVVLADGMAGHGGGEVAGRLAVKTVLDTLDIARAIRRGG